MTGFVIPSVLSAIALWATAEARGLCRQRIR